MAGPGGEAALIGAITLYTDALTDDWVRGRMGASIALSRAAALLRLARPTPEQLAVAVEDLDLAATVKNDPHADIVRWQARFARAQLAGLRDDSRVAGLADLQEAAAMALEQYWSVADEQVLIVRSDQFAIVFDWLAYRYIDFGWNDEALKLIELTRAASLRVYTMSAKERSREIDKGVKKERARHIGVVDAAGPEPVLTLPSQLGHALRRIDDQLADIPIGAAVTAVLRAHHDLPTAYVSYLVTRPAGVEETVVSALVCWLTGKKEWRNERAVWIPSQADVAELYDQRYSAPGPFRERLLQRAAAAGSRALLDPLTDLLAVAGAERLIVSLPGRLSSLPVEAFSRLPGAAPTVTYLPSIRSGRDLVRGAKGRSVAPRVLAIGYGGGDMPAQREEFERLRQLWGKQLTVLPGAQCTKLSALETLGGRFDVIHIAGHGTFAPGRPLESALHFTADLEDDGRRLSARDIVDRVRLSGRPLIVLSACSSAVVADSRTNTYHGLAGSLLRAGARAIVGSRWPVDDAAAATLMSAFHERLREGCSAADLALHAARAAMRADGARIEDWAAFGYLGVV